jgi:hypothetical protein
MNKYPSEVPGAFFVDNSNENLTIFANFNISVMLFVFYGCVAYPIHTLCKTFSMLCV